MGVNSFVEIDSHVKKLKVVEHTHEYYLSPLQDMELIVEDYAKVDYIIINQNRSLKVHINIQMGTSSVVKIYNIIMTSSQIDLKENIDLNGPYGKCEIYNILLTNQKGYINSDININHLVGYTSSNFENYAIAKDNSLMVLNNNATIKQGARKAEVIQKAKGLTLNDTAKIKAMPNLYIDEYDVIANHSAAIGSIAKDDLFYLMSRGLDLAQASSLVVIGFIQPIIDRIDDDKLKKKIYHNFIKKLNT